MKTHTRTSNFKKYLLVTASIALSFVSPLASFAEDENLGIVACAAVTPCDEYGGVIKEFDNGPCAATYRAQCSQTAESSPQDELFKKRSQRYLVAECRNDKNLEKAKYQRRIDNLKRQVRALQRQR